MNNIYGRGKAWLRFNDFMILFTVGYSIGEGGYVLAFSKAKVMAV
jgi:hypothetical protein